MTDSNNSAEKIARTAGTTLKSAFKASLHKALPFVSAHRASTRRTQSKREYVEAQRLKKGEAHVVTYFHDVSDPRSHLTAQALERLTRTYEIDLRIMLVSPQADDVVVARELYETWAIKDTRDIASWYNLDFVDGPHRPDGLAFEMAGRLLSAAIARNTFVEDAPRIGAQLWDGGSAALNALTGELPMAEAKLHARHISDGDKERARQNHYCGALFTYGEECYAGLERLYHLEERLVELGVRNAWSAPKLVYPRRAETAEPLAQRAEGIRLEFFASLQDPYAYIVMERTFRLARQYGLELELRPILSVADSDSPGLRAQRQYITFDAKREAEAAGIDYGRVLGPAGSPIERVYSLYPWARDLGLGNDLLLSFARGAFADGIDGGTDEGLKTIVERAGLNWSEARSRLGNDDWRMEFEGNRVDLFQTGHWDTPTFRIEGGEIDTAFVTRGQDRLWLVEEDVRRRMGIRRGLGLLTG